MPELPVPGGDPELGDIAIAYETVDETTNVFIRLVTDAGRVLGGVEVMKDLKFAETCKYVTMTDTVIYPFAVVMNMERWKALPPRMQSDCKAP